jgi:hypothetical protein
MFKHANRKPLEDSNSLNKLLKLPCMGSHRLPIWFVVSQKSTVRYIESDTLSPRVTSIHFAFSTFSTAFHVWYDVVLTLIHVGQIFIVIIDTDLPTTVSPNYRTCLSFSKYFATARRFCRKKTRLCSELCFL